MKFKKILITLAGLIWMTLLMRALLLNPWGMSFALLLADRTFSVLQFTLLVITCGMMGVRLLRFFKISETQSLFPYGFGLGLSLLSFYVSGLGFLGVLNIWAVGLFFIAALVVGFKEWAVFAVRVREWLKEFLCPREMDLGEQILKGLLTVSCLLLLVGAFTPIVDYDALEYHVALPDLYVHSGNIFSLPHHVFSHFPMNVEMLYGVGLIFGHMEFVKYFNFLLTLLTGVLVFQYASQHWGRKSGLLACVLLLCSIHIGDMTWTAKCDVGLMFFSTAALLLFLEGDFRGRFLAGIFAGMALGSKYTAFLYVWGSLGLLFLLGLMSSKKKGLELKSAFLFLVTSFLVASPWWIRNFIQTGDPIFPFGLPLFKSSLQPLAFYERQNHYYHSLSLFFKNGFWNSPFDMIEKRSCFRPMTYVALPWILMGLKDKRVRVLSLYGLLGYFLGFFKTTGDPKFLLPIFPALAIAASASLLNVTSLALLKKMTVAVLGIFSLWNVGSMGLFLENSDAPQFLFGLIPLNEYLYKRLPQYPAIDFLNQTMKPGERVLFIGEARTFYLERDAIVSTPFDDPAVISFLDGAKDSDEVLKRFQKQNVVYVLINPQEIRRLDRSFPGWRAKVDGSGLKHFLDDYGKLIFRHPKTGIEIYQIKNEKK